MASILLDSVSGQLRRSFSPLIVLYLSSYGLLYFRTKPSLNGKPSGICFLYVEITVKSIDNVVGVAMDTSS